MAKKAEEKIPDLIDEPDNEPDETSGQPQVPVGVGQDYHPTEDPEENKHDESSDLDSDPEEE
jgi:hypothetical protein